MVKTGQHHSHATGSLCSGPAVADLLAGGPAEFVVYLQPCRAVVIWDRKLPRQAIKVWWQDILGVAAGIFVIYCFLVLAGFRTRLLSRKTDRTVESMYSSYADSNRKQRKYAREHGGQWRDDEGGKS